MLNFLISRQMRRLIIVNYIPLGTNEKANYCKLHMKRFMPDSIAVLMMNLEASSCCLQGAFRNHGRAVVSFICLTLTLTHVNQIYIMALQRNVTAGIRTCNHLHDAHTIVWHRLLSYQSLLDFAV